MSKPELVLSNTTSFFIGGIKATFEKALELGFKYLEIIPYRWTTSEEILALEKIYGLKIVGIHLPLWWDLSFRQATKRKPGSLEKLLAVVWNWYLGDAESNPGFAIAKTLSKEGRNPYLLLHTNVAEEMGEKFRKFADQFHLVLENIPYESNYPQFYWNPISIQSKWGERAGLVFDPGHFEQSLEAFPHINILETYKQLKPEVIHISYNGYGIHNLPNKKEREELKQMLKIYTPRYLVLETNPWVSVKKGKKLLENLISETFR